MTGRSSDFYSSPDEVCKIAKIDKVDFNCDTDEELDSYIIIILKDAKSVIDAYVGKTFEAVPEAVHGVARDYCLNVLANVRTISQLNGDISEYTQYPKQSAVFTNDLKQRLDYIVGSTWKDDGTNGVVKISVFSI